MSAVAYATRTARQVLESGEVRYFYQVEVNQSQYSVATNGSVRQWVAGPFNRAVLRLVPRNARNARRLRIIEQACREADARAAAL
jgi:hypothetical protein